MRSIKYTSIVPFLFSGTHIKTRTVQRRMIIDLLIAKVWISIMSINDKKSLLLNKALTLILICHSKSPRIAVILIKIRFYIHSTDISNDLEWKLNIYHQMSLKTVLRIVESIPYCTYLAISKNPSWVHLDFLHDEHFL